MFDPLMQLEPSTASHALLVTMVIGLGALNVTVIGFLLGRLIKLVDGISHELSDVRNEQTRMGQQILNLEREVFPR
ncbi:MAG: hypothetical protein AAF429_14445 [Pseudomonadota bacterium]